MAEPVWVDRLVVELIHDDQLREHGGLTGIRDETALEAALARPQQKWHYEKSDLVTLAAAYAFALCQGHPFRDGNKRAAFVTLVVFLGLNGWDLDAEEPEVVAVMMSLASGQLSERELSDWLKQRARRAR